MVSLSVAGWPGHNFAGGCRTATSFTTPWQLNVSNRKHNTPNSNKYFPNQNKTMHDSNVIFSDLILMLPSPLAEERWHSFADFRATKKSHYICSILVGTRVCKESLRARFRLSRGVKKIQWASRGRQSLPVWYNCWPVVHDQNISISLCCA